jgi:hypothetical protein
MPTFTNNPKTTTGWTGGFLTQENGFFILQENGFKLMIQGTLPGFTNNIKSP